MPKTSTGSKVDDAVGQVLRHLREAQGMSQEALGEAVDVSFQQIQKYERGTNRVGASRLFQFANVFDVPVGRFFEGLPRVRTEDNAGGDFDALVAFAKSKEGQDLIGAFDRIHDKASRSQMIRLIRTMSGEADD
jgi:transcriptional regulator with XRE-family HTH domain